MGKTIFGYITWTMSVVAVVFWFMAEPGAVKNGEGLSVPITIFGVLSLICCGIRFVIFLIDEWD